MNRFVHLLCCAQIPFWDCADEPGSSYQKWDDEDGEPQRPHLPSPVMDLDLLGAASNEGGVVAADGLRSETSDALQSGGPAQPRAAPKGVTPHKPRGAAPARRARAAGKMRAVPAPEPEEPEPPPPAPPAKTPRKPKPKRGRQQAAEPIEDKPKTARQLQQEAQREAKKAAAAAWELRRPARRFGGERASNNVTKAEAPKFGVSRQDRQAGMSPKRSRRGKSSTRKKGRKGAKKSARGKSKPRGADKKEEEKKDEGALPQLVTPQQQSAREARQKPRGAGRGRNAKGSQSARGAKQQRGLAGPQHPPGPPGPPPGPGQRGYVRPHQPFHPQQQPQQMMGAPPQMMGGYGGYPQAVQ